MFPLEIIHYIFSYLSYENVSRLSLYIPKQTIINSDRVLLLGPKYTIRFFNKWIEYGAIMPKFKSILKFHQGDKPESIQEFMLYNSAQYNLVNLVEIFCKNYNSLQSEFEREFQNEKALSIALEYESNEVAKFFIKRCDLLGRSFPNLAVNWLAYNGNMEILRYLFKIHNITDKYIIQDGLLTSSMRNFPNISIFLLEKGATPSFELLKMACKNGHLDLVKTFMDCSKNKFIKNKQLCNGAAKHGHLNVLKYLINLGADLPDLSKAAHAGHLVVVKYLCYLDKQTNNIYDLSEAAQNAYDVGHTDIVDFLIDQGAQLNKTWHDFMWTKKTKVN